MSGHVNRGRVLVVDDDTQVTALLERLLRPEGYDVDVTHDGVAALRSVGRVRPDLIVLDVVLPGLDGFTVCHRLKADPATRLTPVILVTGVRRLGGHAERVRYRRVRTGG